MREKGIKTRHKRRYKATADSKHTLGGAESVEQKLHTQRIEPDLDGGHDLPLDGGVAVSGRGHRTVQSGGAWVVAETAYDGGQRADGEFLQQLEE